MRMGDKFGIVKLIVLCLPYVATLLRKILELELRQWVNGMTTYLSSRKLRGITRLICCDCVGTSSSLDTVVESIVQQPPFKWLTSEEQGLLFGQAVLLSCQQGQRILRPDTLPDRVFLVLSGTVRLLAETPRGSRTLDRRGKGQLLGWVSLMRATPCEWALASENTVLLGVPAKIFVHCLETNTQFYEALSQLRSVHDLDAVLQQAAAADVRLAEGWQKQVQDLGNIDRSWTASAEAGVPFTPPDCVPSGVVWLLSTAEVPGMMLGQAVKQGTKLPSRKGFSLPYRLIGVDPDGSLIRVTARMLSLQTIRKAIL